MMAPKKIAFNAGKVRLSGFTATGRDAPSRRACLTCLIRPRGPARATGSGLRSASGGIAERQRHPARVHGAVRYFSPVLRGSSSFLEASATDAERASSEAGPQKNIAPIVVNRAGLRVLNHLLCHRD
jgi:hypothetical protein